MVFASAESRERPFWGNQNKITPWGEGICSLITGGGLNYLRTPFPGSLPLEIRWGRANQKGNIRLAPWVFPFRTRPAGAMR